MAEEKKQEIGFNTLCENLNREMIASINRSGLPVGAVYFIMKNLMGELEKSYYSTLNTEAINMKETVDQEALEDSTEE